MMRLNRLLRAIALSTAILTACWVAIAPANAQQACVMDLAARTKTGTIQLTWSPVAGAVSYDVLRAGSIAGPFADLANTTSTYATGKTKLSTKP